uniref:J domain-containing protein n=1 Tax=Strongyloides stercoralis TaxID=6248 RepID=A0AAF5CQC4_STRER
MKLYQSCWRVRRVFYRSASYDIKKKNYYEILGIPRDAPDNEIKRAFLKKSRELHPDGDLYKDEDEGTSVNKSHWSYKSKTQSFMELKEAYDVLKKSDTRAEYDSNLYYLESKDGYLMEYPNELLEREEKNNRKKKLNLYKTKNKPLAVGRNISWRFIRQFNYTPHKSYYEILGLSPNATKAEIKAKFYELSKKYHPDVNDSKDNIKNSIKFSEISEAYETLKNDQKRREYDMRRGYGSSMNSQFWQGHDFSNYQNPNGGYYYRRQTFYYGPDKKFSQQRSNRYTQSDFDDIWRRFHKAVNSEEHKAYEKYQEELRNSLWKEYEKRREEAWKKRTEEYQKNNPFNFYKNRKEDNNNTNDFNESTLAKIVGLYILIFSMVTLFQIFFDRGLARSRKIREKIGPTNESMPNEEVYRPIDTSNIPHNVDVINDKSTPDQSAFPYGMPK